MKKRHCIGIGVLLAWSQAYWGQCLSICGITPDLSLVYIVCTALFWGEEYGLATGFSLGMLQDLLFSSFLGKYTFIYIIIGYVSGVIRHNFFHENVEVAVIMTAVFTLLSHIYQMFIEIIYGMQINYLSIFFSGFIIIYNSIICIFIYYLLKKLKKRFGDVRE